MNENATTHKEPTAHQKRNNKINDYTEELIRHVWDLEDSDFDSLYEAIDILDQLSIDLPEIGEVQDVSDLGEEVREVEWDGSNLQELQELFEALSGHDCTIELDGGDYRLIHTDILDAIWSESLEEMLKETTDVPDNVAPYVDWDRWVEDCKHDGAGHHFASYDGNEYESEHWHVVRTN